MAEFFDIIKFAGEFTDDARAMRNGVFDQGSFINKWSDTLSTISTTIKEPYSIGEDNVLSIGNTKFTPDILEQIDINGGNKINETLGNFKPDTENLYRTLGYEDPVLKTDSAQTYFKNENTSLTNRPNFKQATELLEGNQSAKTDSEVSSQIQKNMSNKEITVTDLDNQVRNGKEGTVISSTVKWLAGFVLTAAIIAGGLLALLSAYRDAMNGCWLIDTNTGNKYKILPLTCNQNCLKNAGTNTFQLASYCTNINGPCQSTQFNPMANIIANVTPPPGGTIPPYPTFQPGFVPGTYFDSGPDAGTCTNFSPCLVPCTTMPSSGSNCSDYCSGSYFNLVSGQKIICANFSMGDAFTDIVGKTLDSLGSPLSALGTAIKYLLYGGISIVAIFLAFILVRFLIGIANKKSSSESISTSSEHSEKQSKSNSDVSFILQDRKKK